MGYTFGMQGAPRVGNGLGGLPRRNDVPMPPNTVEIAFNAQNGIRQYQIPRGYNFFRVTVIGAGSIAENAQAGAGGGFAQSAVFKVAGDVIVTCECANDFYSAKFYDQTLVAGYGSRTVVQYSGGTASGGLINNPGGYGQTRGTTNSRCFPGTPGSQSGPGANGTGGPENNVAFYMFNGYGMGAPLDSGALSVSNGYYRGGGVIRIDMW